MKLSFPKKFTLGVADADLQVIGENAVRKEEKSQPTMWYHFAQSSGKCFQNDTPGIGIDRFHRWRQDIDIMKQIGIKHYRTSVSMSRILKQNGETNGNAITWYKNYFKALKRAGIHIYATLYHWELPLFMHEQGGWKNPKTIDLFVKHAQAVVNNLGEYIDEYFVLNEPWCASMLSYHQGVHAPGEKNLADALLAAHNLLIAQGVAFRAMKHIDKRLNVGTVVNTEPAYAYSTDSKDIEAAKRANGYFNLWFWDPIFLGKYPEYMVELYGKAMPKISAADMATIKIGKEMYTFGTNYYCGDVAQYNPKKDLQYSPHINPKGQTNDLGWPIFTPPYYPEGLYDMLQQVWYSYKDHGLKRLYITENGIANYTPWDGKEKIVNDDRRISYYRVHLQQVHKAIRRGIPVAGYFAWTLMDNYEWAEGYRPQSCFGMIHVDRKTLQRVWKKSAIWYQNVLRTNTLF